jgi:type IV pilus assembly protein PilO
LNELAAQIENLKVQLERQRQIVPDEKEAPRFMHLVQAQAAAAGIEIRRYTAKPTSTREFYVEVPFEIELDGSYYSLVNFFERVAKVERIINISGLKMATVNDPKEANPKRRYQYAPSESVVATCTATTFFSSQAAAVQSGSAGGR